MKLERLMDEVEGDDAVRALVVISTHRSLFSPGVDLPSLVGKSAIGVVAMVRHVLGGRLAERVLFRGERYTVEQALAMGLVDEVVERERLLT